MAQAVIGWWALDFKVYHLLSEMDCDNFCQSSFKCFTIVKMTFTTPSSYTPPTICGYNTGQHIYLDSSRSSLSTNPVMELAFSGKIKNQLNIDILLSPPIRKYIFSILENQSGSDSLWHLLHSTYRMSSISDGDKWKL